MTKTYEEWLKTNEEVANKIINKHQLINVEYNGWCNSILEEFCEKVESFGFNVDVDDINYSGFWTQGDGASFTGDINILEYLSKTRQKTKYRNVIKCIENEKISNDVDIERGSLNYVHENTCYVDNIEIYDCIDTSCELSLNELRVELENKRCNLCKELYSVYKYLKRKLNEFQKLFKRI